MTPTQIFYALMLTSSVSGFIAGMIGLNLGYKWGQSAAKKNPPFFD
jgi:hypothetical protein